MFERFAAEAKDVVRRAERRAARAGDGAIDAEHLLLALAETPDTSAGRVLAAVGVDDAVLADAVARDEIELLRAVGVTAEPRESRPALGRRLRFTPASKKALEGALRAAVDRGERRIETRHVLLGLVRPPVGRVDQVLLHAGTDAATVRRVAEAA